MASSNPFRRGMYSTYLCLPVPVPVPTPPPPPKCACPFGTIGTIYRFKLEAGGSWNVGAGAMDCTSCDQNPITDVNGSLLTGLASSGCVSGITYFTPTLSASTWTVIVQSGQTVFILGGVIKAGSGVNPCYYNGDDGTSIVISNDCQQITFTKNTNPGISHVEFFARVCVAPKAAAG